MADGPRQPDPHKFSPDQAGVPDASPTATHLNDTGAPTAATAAHRTRYRRILWFAARAIVAVWWADIVLPRFGFTAWSDRTRTARAQRIAKRFHTLAVDLGGLMIKVGQFLSSRLDVLPPEITDELAGLQDEVPAVPFPHIRAVVEVELGMPLGRAYEWFDEHPVAAASLGQAHRARLSPEHAADAGFANVVVKVQRPGIDAIIDVDLAALRRVGSWLSRVRIVANKVDAPMLVEEFARTSLEEVDYLHEAANADRFTENFAADVRVAAPQVAWERSTRRVLTLSDVTAIKINDLVGLRASGIDPAEVADTFAAVMFDQIFDHSFFHADPHPGNVFVTPLPVAADASGPRWRLTFIDFGMMGEVPPTLRAGLRKLVIAIAARDGKALVAAAQQIGVLLPTGDTRDLEKALTALFARFGGMGFAELSHVDPHEFQHFAAEFGDTVRRLPVQLPEGMLLLFRAVSLTSGMCSALNPAFNVWDAVEPHAARLIKEESVGFVRGITQQATHTAGVTWRLPGRIDGVIDSIEEGSLVFDTSRIERRLSRLEHLVRRAVSAVMFAGLIVAGALVVPSLPVLGGILMGLSAVPLIHAVFAGMIRRD